MEYDEKGHATGKLPFEVGVIVPYVVVILFILFILWVI